MLVSCASVISLYIVPGCLFSSFSLLNLHFSNAQECKLCNPYAAADLFGQYKMMQKIEKSPKPTHRGTHITVLSESFPMNTNMTDFRCFSKIFASVMLWTKIASALEGL